MATLLVSYNAQDADHGCTGLVDAIRHYRCAKLSDLSYAISTNESPKEVYEKLSRYSNGVDSLYVIPLQGPWEGQGPNYVNNLFRSWLQ